VVSTYDSAIKYGSPPTKLTKDYRQAKALLDLHEENSKKAGFSPITIRGGARTTTPTKETVGCDLKRVAFRESTPAIKKTAVRKTMTTGDEDEDEDELKENDPNPTPRKRAYSMENSPSVDSEKTMNNDADRNTFLRKRVTARRPTSSISLASLGGYPVATLGGGAVDSAKAAFNDSNKLTQKETFPALTPANTPMVPKSMLETKKTEVFPPTSFLSKTSMETKPPQGQSAPMIATKEAAEFEHGDGSVNSEKSGNGSAMSAILNALVGLPPLHLIYLGIAVTFFAIIPSLILVVLVIRYFLL